jgi:hypothetical protein
MKKRIEDVEMNLKFSISPMLEELHVLMQTR